jgi:hypothetical protein
MNSALCCSLGTERDGVLNQSRLQEGTGRNSPALNRFLFAGIANLASGFRSLMRHSNYQWLVVWRRVQHFQVGRFRARPR